jgi:hypothetical protein
MTHPPSGPSQPPRPSGPREPVAPLDPDSEAGQQMADAISAALAHVLPDVLARRNNSSKRHGTDAA